MGLESLTSLMIQELAGSHSSCARLDEGRVWPEEGRSGMRDGLLELLGTHAR